MDNSLIKRQDAIDAILGLTNCDTVEGLRAYVKEHDLGSWWSGGVLSSVGKVERLPSADAPHELMDWQRLILEKMARDIPSAEKAQLSEEDATKDATSGLIRRVDAIDALGKEPKFKIKMIKTYAEGRSDQWFKDVASIASLPSVEPKTPSNGSITSMNTEKMHVRTTDGLIRRQDVLHELEGCDYELKDWQRWKLKTMVRDIPSAEPEIIHCKDCRKHNVKVGFDEDGHTVWKEDACPLVSWRGKAKGHEFDYQHCSCAELRGEQDE